MPTLLPQAFDIETACRIVGILGFLTYMFGFAALQLRWICGNGPLFSTINILAATLVLISLAVDFNLASALIQVSWITMGSFGLLLHRFGARDLQEQAVTVRN